MSTGKAAMTTGHTIRFKKAKPDEKLIFHEVQHVYDIETLGGFVFYTAYAVTSVACGCYEDSLLERRAYYVSRNFPEVEPRGFGWWSRW